jgi:hypothetical protein
MLKAEKLLLIYHPPQFDAAIVIWLISGILQGYNLRAVITFPLPPFAKRGRRGMTQPSREERV